MNAIVPDVFGGRMDSTMFVGSYVFCANAVVPDTISRHRDNALFVSSSVSCANDVALDAFSERRNRTAYNNIKKSRCERISLFRIQR